MTALSKLEANRKNAQLSTGPRTSEGKAIVSKNALRHGVFAAVPVVDGENAQEWADHRTGVLESLAPMGLLEVNLAERVALLLWRLRARTTSAEHAKLPRQRDLAGVCVFARHFLLTTGCSMRSRLRLGAYFFLSFAFQVGQDADTKVLADAGQDLLSRKDAVAFQDRPLRRSPSCLYVV
jgi:hypothetical protein